MLAEHKILIDFINNRFEELDLNSLTLGNWATIVSEASRHRIAPLLYNKIKLSEAESMFPADVLRRLREKYLANTYRNTVLFHQLTKLVALLNNKCIPVILLKGAHLAEFVYRDISLRPMSDLDILVKEEHLSEAVQIAFNAGYQFFSDKNPEKDRAGVHYDYGIMPHSKHFQALIHPETNCMLEIHCFITSKNSPFDIPASELWETARPATLNENGIFLLSPEDLVIHLCLHAAYDDLFAFGMGTLCDISTVINHYGDNLNWGRIQYRSNQWRTNQCLLLTLYFTKKWLGAGIPDEIFENFRVDGMIDIAEKRIFKVFGNAPLHMHYIRWRNCKGKREKISYIQKVLFPSRNYMADRYLQPKNSRFLFSSYLFRFLQAVKGSFSILNAALKDVHYDSKLNHGDSDLRLREWLIKS